MSKNGISRTWPNCSREIDHPGRLFCQSLWFDLFLALTGFRIISTAVNELDLCDGLVDAYNFNRHFYLFRLWGRAGSRDWRKSDMLLKKLCFPPLVFLFLQQKIDVFMYALTVLFRFFSNKSVNFVFNAYSLVACPRQLLNLHQHPHIGLPYFTVLWI